MRPFRLLLAVVIGAALQLCCCSTRALAQSAGGLVRDTVAGHARGCCRDQSASQGGAPNAPTRPDPDGDHRCLCGMSKHATGAMDRDGPIDGPQVGTMIAGAPSAAAGRSDRPADLTSRTPAIRERSLLRQHCALIL